MGRWAQRRIRGGDFPTPSPSFTCATCTSASIDDAAHCSAHFDVAVDALAFDLGLVNTTPSGATCISINQVSPTVVTFQWDADISADTTLQLDDMGGPPICVLQNVPYT